MQSGKKKLEWLAQSDDWFLANEISTIQALISEFLQYILPQITKHNGDVSH